MRNQFTNGKTNLRPVHSDGLWTFVCYASDSWIYVFANEVIHGNQFIFSPFLANKFINPSKARTCVCRRVRPFQQDIYSSDEIKAIPINHRARTTVHRVKWLFYIRLMRMEVYGTPSKQIADHWYIKLSESLIDGVRLIMCVLGKCVSSSHQSQAEKAHFLDKTL